MVCLSPAIHTCVLSKALTAWRLLAVVDVCVAHVDPFQKAIVCVLPTAHTWVLSSTVMPLSWFPVGEVSDAHVIPPSVVFRIRPVAPTAKPVEELIIPTFWRLVDVNFVDV